MDVVVEMVGVDLDLVDRGGRERLAERILHAGQPERMRAGAGHRHARALAGRATNTPTRAKREAGCGNFTQPALSGIGNATETMISSAAAPC